jgi:hypothetical protein
MSLDRMAEILSWSPMAELDPARLNAVVTIARVVLMIGAKAGLLARPSERDRHRILSDLTRREFGDDASDRTGKNRPRAEGR